jgi:iron(III) transport system ATP-binding protein
VTDSQPTPAALICADLRKSYGSIVAVDDISLAVAPGELMALLGPSGCGKTTTLRLIAGFERPDLGTVHIGGKEVVGSGRFQPPERRHVGMVFQDYALFPHLTVAANVAYGLPNNSASGAAATIRNWTKKRFGGEAELSNRVREVLDLVELTELAQRYPDELSGGEAQRVALARALAPSPALILLDEPFSNLDARLRASVRTEVRDILRRAGAAAIFVTHDQEEAFSLADRVVVMHRGRVEQVGTPDEIYQHPASRFVASFVGDADFLPGQVQSDGIHTEIGLVPVPPSVSAPHLIGTNSVDIMLRPESFLVEAMDHPEPAELDRRPNSIDTVPGIDSSGDQPATAPTGNHPAIAPPAGNPPAIAPAGNPPAIARVIGHEYYGHDQMLTVRLRSGRLIRARLGPSDKFRPGDHVRLRFQGHPTVFTTDERSPIPLLHEGSET